MRIVIGFIALAGCQFPWTENAEQRAEKKALETIRVLFNDSFSKNNRSITVTSAVVDLNDDGVSEVLTYVKGDDACGSGGCNLLILQAKNGGYDPVSELTISWPPIRILESKSNGWRDIAVWVQGGGILPGYEARLRFDGKSYPSNPSLLPREKGPAPNGRIVISHVSPSTPLYK